MNRSVFLIASVINVYINYQKCCVRNPIYSPYLEFISKYFQMCGSIKSPGITKYIDLFAYCQPSNNNVIKLSIAFW